MSLREKLSHSALALSTILCCAAGAASAQVVRTDHVVPSDPGVSIFVREVRVQASETRQPPILLLHGARVPGVASFDLPVPGGSLAADLAQAGHLVYIMDARGYGRSTRPAEMSGPARDHSPLVRSPEVVRDVAAVVEWIRGRGAQRVALLGWATGGHWLGYYATMYPEHVSHLILYNTLYGATKGHPTLGPRSDLEDPHSPGLFNAAAFGAYRFNTAESLFPAWDRSIPLEDKTAWRDPAIASAYAAAALASDATAEQRTPPSFRAPSGALEDSYYLASGRQLWDASLVRAPTLILSSARDFWARPEDRTSLQEHLVHAPRVRIVNLPNATHFVHLDRPERGRARFIREVLTFIGDLEE
ncbi:MAG: alpha/beta hydrolase [Gemmatimonadaceae bacterium]